MGFVQNVKAITLANDARKAADSGRTVFTALLAMPGTRADFSGEVVDWSKMIEAVEAEGWRLEQMTASTPAKGDERLIVLFRR